MTAFMAPIGDRVVVAEDAIRHRLRVQQVPHGLIAHIVVVTGMHDIFRRHDKLVRLEGLAIPLEPRRCDAHSWAAQMRDATATLRDQVIGGEFPDGFIVHTHEAGRNACHGTVNQYKWNLAIPKVFKQGQLSRGLS